MKRSREDNAKMAFLPLARRFPTTATTNSHPHVMAAQGEGDVFPGERRPGHS